MLLEFVIWRSREWYEVVIPLLEKAGFEAVPAKGWTDPESDGERMAMAFDYTGTVPLSADQMQVLLVDIQRILKDAEAPLEAINFRSA